MSKKVEKDEVVDDDGPTNKNDWNPLWNEQSTFLKSIPANIRESFFDEQVVSPDVRATIWSQQAQLGEQLVNQYSWATPPKKLQTIFQHFSPLVEIGCGANAYWSNLFYNYNTIDIIAYDMAPQSGGQIILNTNGKKRNRNGGFKSSSSSIPILQGGPEVLNDPRMKNRTLFLCYPDEDDYTEEQDDNDNNQEEEQEEKPMSIEEFKQRIATSNSQNDNDDDDSNVDDPEQSDNGENEQKPLSIEEFKKQVLLSEDNDNSEEDVGEDDIYIPKSMGYQCLENYQGSVIIHVGELMDIDYGTLCMDGSQAPWGRSSSCDFQQKLMTEFHCIFKMPLTNWLHTRDTLTIWKRSQSCTLYLGDEDSTEDDDDDNDEQETLTYKHIPRDEQLLQPHQILMAPCLQHLFDTKQPK